MPSARNIRMEIGWPLVSATLMVVLSLISFELVTFDGRVSVLWLANGAVIALMLRRPQATWPALLAAALAGNIVAALTVGDELLMASALALCNAAEILIVAYLFKRRHPDPIRAITLQKIGSLAWAGLVGATLSTAMAVAAFYVLGTTVGIGAAAPWFLADLNGLLMITPLALSLSLGATRSDTATSQPSETFFLFALALAVSLAIFSFKVSSLFLMAPVLVLAALRLNVRRTATLLAMVCIIAGAMTVSGQGPLNAPHIGADVRIFLLQLFMSTAVLLTLPVAVIRMERLATAVDLRNSEQDYRLLSDHGSDLILRLDGEGNAGFLSGAAQRLLGLESKALAGRRWIDRLHPDDRPRFATLLQDGLREGEGLTCFRIRHADGSWLWVDASVRVARPNLQEESASPPTEVMLIATLRDVQRRRRAELLADERQDRLRDANRLLVMAEGLAGLGHWTFDHELGTLILSAEAQAMVHLPTATLLAAEAIAGIATEDRRMLLARMALARRVDVPVECTVRFAAPTGERVLQLRMQQQVAAGGGGLPCSA